MSIYYICRVAKFSRGRASAKPRDIPGCGRDALKILEHGLLQVSHIYEWLGCLCTCDLQAKHQYIEATCSMKPGHVMVSLCCSEYLALNHHLRYSVKQRIISAFGIQDICLEGLITISLYRFLKMPIRNEHLQE